MLRSEASTHWLQITAPIPNRLRTLWANPVECVRSNAPDVPVRIPQHTDQTRHSCYVSDLSQRLDCRAPHFPALVAQAVDQGMDRAACFVLAQRDGCGITHILNLILQCRRQHLGAAPYITRSVSQGFYQHWLDHCTQGFILWLRADLFD